jgi:hypothetical protein
MFVACRFGSKSNEMDERAHERQTDGWAWQSQLFDVIDKVIPPMWSYLLARQ